MTAIFQLWYALVRRPLPVPDAGQLVVLDLADRTAWNGRRTTGYPALSNPAWEALRDRQTILDGVFAWATTEITVGEGAATAHASGLMVSGTFFSVLGVPPALGRVLAPADDTPSCPAVAVASDGFWQRHFGADPNVVGRFVDVDGLRVQLVGVTPRAFTGLEVGRAFDIAVPVCLQPRLRGSEAWMRDPDVWWLTVMGRLPVGTSLAAANARLEALSKGIFDDVQTATTPAGGSGVAGALRLRAEPAAAGVSALRARYGSPLLALLGATALVLLVTCTNLANLALARASAREREFAVRLALGAPRARLARQLMLENGLVAVLGAAAGALAARVLVGAAAGWMGPGLSIDTGVDRAALIFITSASAFACLAFGLLPAWRLSATPAADAMRATTRGASASPRTRRLRESLVVAQVALSVSLVFGALILSSTLRHLEREDTGFRVDDVAAVRVDLGGAPLAADTRTIRRSILDRARQAPGVVAAAEVRHTPFSGTGSRVDVGRPGDRRPPLPMRLNAISPGYLRALEIPLLEGRDFTDADTRAAQPVALVNPTFARRLGLAGSPVGQEVRLTDGPDGDATLLTIVGVVPDTKYFTMREAALPIVFVPIAQIDDPRAVADYVVRLRTWTAVAQASLEASMATASAGVVADARPLAASVAASLRRERLLARLSTGFGLLATTIAAVGLYGLVSLLVAQRTTEIGVRVALGAPRRAIRVMVLWHAGRLVGLGVTLGAILSLALAGSLRALVFGVQPWDPWLLAGACAILAAVTLVAAAWPAQRAARLDALAALRAG
ncbi:MAG: ADOP family duplicated permease [Vicinamibacterales bacterium]